MNNADVANNIVNKLPSSLIITLVIAVVVIICVIMMLIILKPGEEEREVNLLGIHIKIGAKKKKDSDTPITASQDNSTVHTLQDCENSLERATKSIDQVTHQFILQRDQLLEASRKSIDSMRTNSIHQIVSKVIQDYTKSLDAEATQFDLKRQIFKLAMNYDFNEILINKLKALQDNPVSTFSDTTTIVADAANDVVNSIKNRLYDYEVFQDDDESKKAFENIFNQNLDVLGHSIDQFIKSYQQKTKEEKDAEQALIQERNEHIALQLTNIFLNNKGRNII